MDEVPYHDGSRQSLPFQRHLLSFNPSLASANMKLSLTEQHDFQRFFHNYDLLVDEDEQSLQEKSEVDMDEYSMNERSHNEMIVCNQPKINAEHSHLGGNIGYMVLRVNTNEGKNKDELNFLHFKPGVSENSFVRVQSAQSSTHQRPQSNENRTKSIPTHQGSIFESQDSTAFNQDRLKAKIPQDKKAGKGNKAKYFNPEAKILGEKWYKRYQELVAFKELHGHCNVSRKNDQTKKLAAWVCIQRYIYKNTDIEHRSHLENKRIEALKTLGFVWDNDEMIGDKWQARYNELIEYKRQNGHCNVPWQYGSNKQLSRWVCSQRFQYKKARQGHHSFITPDRVEALNKIGFDWSPIDKYRGTWQQRYKELVEFKKIHGHCNVSQRYKPNKRLGLWVNNQRHWFKHKYDGNVKDNIDERVRLLEEIGFEWNV